MKTWAGGGSYGWPAPPGRDRQNRGAAGTKHRWCENRVLVIPCYKQRKKVNKNSANSRTD